MNEVQGFSTNKNDYLASQMVIRDMSKPVIVELDHSQATMMFEGLNIRGSVNQLWDRIIQTNHCVHDVRKVKDTYELKVYPCAMPHEMYVVTINLITEEL